MEVNNIPITNALTLLNSLRHEIITMQSDTVSMETLITNLFKYFAVLRDEIVVPDAHSSGLQDKLDEISQSLTACKDLVLRHKSSGEVILRQADLVGESCLQAKGASQSETAERTFPDSRTGFVSLENSLTLNEVNDIIGGSDSDNDDAGILDNFACLDVTVKNEIGLDNQSLEVFGNQSLSVGIHANPPQEVTNSKNAETSLLLKCEYCDDIYESELDFNTHLQSHSQEDTKDTLRCNECRKTFNSKQALSYHRRHSKAHQKMLTKTCKTIATFRKPVSETLSAKSKLKPSGSEQNITEANMGSRTRASTRKPVFETISDKSKLKPSGSKKQKSGCAECGKCFKTVRALDVHMAQKHKGGKYTCGPCNKAYRSKAGLEYHLTASNAHKNPIKIEDPDPFEVAENDSKSAENNDNTEDKSCTQELSGSILPSKEKMKPNIIKKKKYKCNICGRGYTSRNGLWCHRKISKHFKELKSNDKKLLKAPAQNGDQLSNDGSSTLTDKHINGENTLTKTSEAGCQEAMERLPCVKCGRQLKNPRSLRRHLKAGRCVRDKIEKSFICHQCGKKFSTKWGMQVHIKNQHGTPVLETCEVCGVQVPRLKHHMATHEEKQYRCPQCDKSFRSKDSLNKHLDHHSGIKPHMCYICGKAYTIKSSLEYHMAGHLNSKTAFKCDVCGKGFFHKGLLITHNRVHSEAKFKCKICGKFTRTKGQLQTHMVTHTGEKTHKCKICGEMFKHLSRLRRHVLKHTGQKPYVCPHCSKAFLDHWGRKQHMDRCLYGDRRRKEYRDSKTGAEAALSPVTGSLMASPGPGRSEPIVKLNLGQFMEQVPSQTQSLQAAPSPVTGSPVASEPVLTGKVCEPLVNMNLGQFMEQVPSQTQSLQERVVCEPVSQNVNNG